MRANYIKLFIIIVLILCMTAGCWDSRDIEEKSIVTAVVVDKTDIGYAFYVEIASIGQQSNNQGNGQQGSAQKKNIILRSEGSNFAEAREDLDRKANSPIYLGADQCVILTEKMACSGIEEYMYRLRQIPDYRKTLDVVVTTEKPEDLLNANTGNKDQAGLAIMDTLQTLVDEGHCIHFSLADLLETLASPYKCYFIPVIGLRDTEIALTGYSVFYGDACKGFVPAAESEGLIMMRAEKPAGIFSVPYRDRRTTVETHVAKRDTDVDYTDGRITINLRYEFDCMLLYLSKNMAVTDEVTQGIRSELEKMLEEEISDTILTSQKYFGYDYLNFYNLFRIKYPNAAKTIDWLHEYPDAEFNVDVVVNLDTNGKLDYNPRIEENEEGEQE